jgi:hypothetical protein
MTASQTNREGGSSEVATMMHAADNIEKVRICDLIISINKTEEEEAKGEARLFLLVLVTRKAALVCECFRIWNRCDSLSESLTLCRKNEGVPKRNALISIQKFKLSFANKTTKENTCTAILIYGRLNARFIKCQN